jgi:hypothetical protein
MPINVDRYPKLGPKLTVATLEEAIERVQAVYPGTSCEGSTGSERSWATIGDTYDVVAHTWSPCGRLEKYHLRIRPLSA